MLMRKHGEEIKSEQRKIKEFKEETRKNRLKNKRR